MSKQVQVDDTDTGLQYSSGWSAIPGDQYNNQGNFGSTYLNTLHSATTAASFTYTFNGADGTVWGTTSISNNSAGVIDPTWECLVDGKSIPLKDPFRFVENNWILCSWDSSTVPLGQHTLTVNVQSGGRAFLFDYFTYVPSPNANVNNAGIRLSCTDSALKYGSGWEVYGGDLGRMAPAGGAPVSLTFYGTGIIWYGTAPTERPHPNSIASYNIDGQPSTTFTVPGVPGQDTEYHLLYFQTPPLSLGHHTIVITSGGLTSQTPTVLSYIIIQGGSVQEPPPPNTIAPSVAPTNAQPAAGSLTTTLPTTASILTNTAITSQTQLLPPFISTATSASASANTTPNANANQPASTGGNATVPTGGASSGSSNARDPKSSVVNGSGSGTPIGTIVGGVLGAVVSIAIMMALMICWRRRRASEKVQVQQPFYSNMTQSQSVFSVVHSGGALSSTNEASFNNGHAYLPHHGGHAGGTFTKARPPEDSNLRADAAPSNHVEHLTESSSQIYTTDYTPESSTHHGRVVNHEDSGYRIRPAGSSQALRGGAVMEFPPAYSRS